MWSPPRKNVTTWRISRYSAKFHIFKIEFLHEKIIFFCLDFFPDKVYRKNHKIFQNLKDGCAVLLGFFSDICRVHFWTLLNHTLSGKKSRPKNIIFSWRNLIFKMWNLSRNLEIRQVLILFRGGLHLPDFSCTMVTEHIIEDGCFNTNSCGGFFEMCSIYLSRVLI